MLEAMEATVSLSCPDVAVTIMQWARAAHRLPQRNFAMSIDSTRNAIMRYVNSAHRDVSMMAQDVTFTIMATGQEHHGPVAVTGMLNYFYHVAFDATATTNVTLFGENNAMIEGEFVGKHIGEFAGVPATGKDVRVPICVVYDLTNDQIKRGRVYFEMPALLQQLGVSMG